MDSWRVYQMVGVVNVCPIPTFYLTDIGISQTA